MKDRLTIPCPAEKYGAEDVAETMTRLYPSQWHCSASHGCAGNACLLEGYWPEEQAEAPEESAAEATDEPPAMACCDSCSWEFLGSD